MTRFRSLVRFFFVMVFCAVLITPALSQKINVQYDKSLDFSKFKSFAFAEHDVVSRPMLAAAVMGAVQHDLVRVGLKQVTENPDLYVRIYGSVDSDMSVTYVDPLYGSMPGIPAFDMTYGMWGMMPGGTTAVTVRKGELVVDVLNAREKKLVWRGVAREKLSDKKDKLLDQVNTAVEKMFQQYPVKPQ